MSQKLFLQKKLEYFGGDFDKLLEDIEKYATLPEVEEYEYAADIRDYRKKIIAPIRPSATIFRARSSADIRIHLKWQKEYNPRN